MRCLHACCALYPAETRRASGLARGVAARIAHGTPIDRALATALDELVALARADAGLIVIDREGRLAAGTTTATMPIAWSRADTLDACVVPPVGWTLG